MLRQLFCGVAFLVPFILFRWDVLDAWMKVGDEYSMPKIWLGVAMLILFGTLLYHIEKNIFSYGYDVLRIWSYQKSGLCAKWRREWCSCRKYCELRNYCKYFMRCMVYKWRRFIPLYLMCIMIAAAVCVILIEGDNMWIWAICAVVIFFVSVLGISWMKSWKKLYLLSHGLKMLDYERGFDTMVLRKFKIWQAESAAGKTEKRLWAHASKWSDMIHCGMTSAIACLLGIVVMHHVSPNSEEKTKICVHSTSGLVCYHGGCGKTPNVSIFWFNDAQTKDAHSSDKQPGSDSKGGWANLGLPDGEAVLFWFCVFIIGLELFCMWHRDIQLDLMLQYGCDKKMENEGEDKKSSEST